MEHYIYNGKIMLTKASKEGVEAYINGKSVNDNPYPIFVGGSWNNYTQWQDGFLDAEAIVCNDFDQDQEVKEYMETLKNKE